jgi:lysozyme family protein
MANFQNIKSKTLKWESGLSRATTDTASNNPSPCTYDGKTGWHTNKGVIWTTFNSLSSKLGYQANCDNFINMPDAIWDKIAKNQFWDDLKLDSLKSDGVAFQLFSWHWGAGTGWFPRIDRYLNSKGIDWNTKGSTLSDAFNKLIDKQGEKQTIDDLQQQQIEFYQSLNQPANLKGWINRVKDTTAYAYKYIGNFVSENKTAINYGLVGVVLVVSSIFAYRYYKKNK